MTTYERIGYPPRRVLRRAWPAWAVRQAWLMLLVCAVMFVPLVVLLAVAG